ncbi:hypothetical protein XENOCAPTIV_001192 [Xenoophorus captivus]|uniref:HAT C-terminal dimerisation domain-containing protein n=1 Tax=Xenoophorus captivus TaxID=1517983 RepID=A0ABV0S4R7_9TELE
MLGYLNKKHELLDITSCLDTRFKIDFIITDKKSQVTARVESERMEIQETPHFSSAVEPKVAATPQEKKDKNCLSSFFKEKVSRKVSRAAKRGDSFLSLKDSVEAELKNYLLIPSVEKEEDPLTWWKIHKVNFP